MSQIARNIEGLIGNTPLLELSKTEKALNLKGRVLAKLEFANPGRSVKDRVALALINQAEREGLINKGTTIIEPTSGNTGVGLAIVAASRGYRIILTMPDAMTIERHEHELTEYARQQISRIPGITIIGNPKHRVSVISLDIPGIPAPEVGQLLDKEGIAVRAGHHCAQPALRALGYEMSVRPTFAVYNTKEEVDRLVIALQKIVADRK